MKPEIISVITAAVVSLAIAAISYITNRRAIQVEREKHNVEMQRRLTEKLYDMRLASYPEAFKITHALRGTYLLHNEISIEYVTKVLEELQNWYGMTAAMHVTARSSDAFIKLRDILIKNQLKTCPSQNVGKGINFSNR